MTENKPLIIPELVALDADAGPGKEDVIEFLATTVAGAGRASSPDGLAADAKKRESTAPTGIPGASRSRTAAARMSWPPASVSPAWPNRSTSGPPTARTPTSSS